MRIAFDRSNWKPEKEDEGAEFTFLLDLLSHEEAEKVKRFKFFADKQRALISRLMQRKCVEQCLGMAWESIEIKRTKGRKPFLANAREKPEHMPNFNYNVSHEGDYIVLAAEPVCIAGVDIAAPGQTRKNKEAFRLDEIFSRFRDQFTSFEWENIRKQPDQKSQEDAFRRNWSCKEAFTKARGDGIGFELKRCEFDIKESPPEGYLPFTHIAHVRVDGKEVKDDWIFYLQPLRDHWVTVARGPPSDVIDAYGEFTKTMQKRFFSTQEWKAAIQARQTGFSIIGIRDLLPKEPKCLEEYEALVEEDPFG